MLKICLFFQESEPQYAYKLYAYKKRNMYFRWMHEIPGAISETFYHGQVLESVKGARFGSQLNYGMLLRNKNAFAWKAI